MSILTRCQEGVNPHAYTLETITIITTVYQLRCHALAITLAVSRLYLIRLTVAKLWLCPETQKGSSVDIEVYNLESEH